MNTDKNIDRLFQERLKNLEVTPNQKVWKEIASKITKKKRTIFPFWWFSSGVAALLIIGFSLFPFDDSNHQIKQKNSKEIITKTPDATIESLVKDTSEIKIVQKNEKEVSPINKKLITKKRPNNRLAIQVKTFSKEKKEIFNTDVSVIREQPFEKEKIFTVVEDILEKTQESKVIIAEHIENSKNNKDANKIAFKKIIEDPKEEKAIENSNKKNWSIAPVFAVLSSNSFTNTSPINSSLSGSTKGQNSISYGVQIAYQIDEKWSIQSGLHLQEIRFKNKQITVISSSINASNIAFNSEASFAFENNSEASFDSSLSPLDAISLDGELAQNYSYYEIPLEIKYHLTGHKNFRTYLIGGFSTLFLKENQVRLSTSSLHEQGKANNLNSVNFSGNLGIDLNYMLNTNWSLHINPMFKTQLNTFSENSNGFSPFNIGVYTGIHFQF